jgi:hypothetical protein
MSNPDKLQSPPVSGPHARSPAAGEQPALLPASQAEPDSDAEEFLPLAIPEPGRRGPGKPKGSVNIRTNTTFQAAISRYGDPLIAEIAWGNMDTLTLIRELRKIASDAGLKLGATVMDVVRFQQQCRASALPFGHAKRASVDDKGEPVLPTFLGIGRVQVAPGGHVTFKGQSLEDLVDVTPNEEIQQNQGPGDDQAK